MAKEAIFVANSPAMVLEMNDLDLWNLSTLPTSLARYEVGVQEL